MFTEVMLGACGVMGFLSILRYDELARCVAGYKEQHSCSGSITYSQVRKTVSKRVTELENILPTTNSTLIKLIISSQHHGMETELICVKDIGRADAVTGKIVISNVFCLMTCEW